MLAGCVEKIVEQENLNLEIIKKQITETADPLKRFYLISDYRLARLQQEINKKEKEKHES